MSKQAQQPEKDAVDRNTFIAANLRIEKNCPVRARTMILQTEQVLNFAPPEQGATRPFLPNREEKLAYWRALGIWTQQNIVELEGQAQGAGV